MTAVITSEAEVGKLLKISIVTGFRMN